MHILDLFLGQCCIPNLDFIDYASKVGIPCTVYTKFVDLNTVDRAVGYTLIQDLNAIEIKCHTVVFKCGNQVLPNRWINGSKAVRIVVIQLPISWISSTGLNLEGIVIPRNIVDCDGR